MADTEILKRAEKYIKGKGKTLNKYDLVGFANAETELLSKHILELQADKGILTDENKQAKELLKTVLDWQCRYGDGYPTWQEVCAKIGQFLSEVEK